MNPKHDGYSSHTGMNPIVVCEFNKHHLLIHSSSIREESGKIIIEYVFGRQLR